jgi:hypothetical protein
MLILIETLHFKMNNLCLHLYLMDVQMASRSIIIDRQNRFTNRLGLSIMNLSMNKTPFLIFKSFKKKSLQLFCSLISQNVFFLKIKTQHN